MRRCLSLLALLPVASLVFSCAAAKDDGYVGSNASGSGGSVIAVGGSAGAPGGSDAGGQGGSATGGSGAGTGGTGINIGGQAGSSSSDNLLIYAHTDQTLFQMDPEKLDAGLVEIGPFECVGDTAAGQDKAMTDLAVDRQQNLWGVSQNAVYRLEVQDKTVVCKETIKLQVASQNPDSVRFYGLTFAPAGVVDPDKEVLVAGNTAGEMWAIDTSGNIKLLGHFGDVPANDGNGNSFANAGKRWELSGDIVFVEGKDEPLGFATVRDCPNPPSTSGCNNVNTLIELDMKKLGKAAPGPMTKAVRGQIVQRKGCNDGLDGKYGNMYGISAWNDRVYGFSRDGHLVDVATADGTGCLVKTFDSVGFSGAGITTIAPVEAPPIK